MFSRPALVKALLLNLATFAASASISLGPRDDSAETPGPTSLVLPFKNVGNPYNFRRVDFLGDSETIYVANITVDGSSYEVCHPSMSTSVIIVLTRRLPPRFS